MTQHHQLVMAGAGGIEPCNNPLPHKDFFILARPFDPIFDSKAKALVGMTDDEAAYIEARGWKASVVLEPSIHPPLRELLWMKRRSVNADPILTPQLTAPRGLTT